MMKQILLAATGATGFAAIFGLPRKWFFGIWMLSGAAWCGYLLLGKALESEWKAMFGITVLVMLCAKILTRKKRFPAFVIATPVLIPFIPGATLYLVMSDFVSRKESLLENLNLLLLQVGAIAMGIFMVEILYRESDKVRKNEMGQNEDRPRREWNYRKI